MDNQRRHFLRALAPGAMLAGVGFVAIKSTLAFDAQSPTRPPAQNPSTMAPPAAPAFRPPSKAELQKNQREITKDVDELFALAQQLKRQAEKNDASEELSVALIEKTEEIEKLAKKIRDLARS
jgi:uncharacterized coiled-coil protein SlyX